MTFLPVGAIPWGLQQEPPPGIPQEAPPLPGGVAAIVRWFFHVPQWIQIGGAILGAVLAAVVVWFLWKRRVAIWTWLKTRAVAIQLGLATVAVVVIAVAAWAGTVSWNYMMHDNDFCTACHVMGSSFQRFATSEHSTLNCHDCHQQSIFASSRQLYLWVVDRPEEIGDHAPVPTARCTDCHQTERDSTWQRVLQTAGHTIHLESDSSALAGVECVTCHGQEVHRFVPASQTCGQADCHASETTQIVLGAMAAQTGFHCVSCHEFTLPLAEGTTVAGAEEAITPANDQCLACHDMEALLDPFDPATEPHDAVCGDCHNPHVQETPGAAIASCTGAGCHAAADTLSPFHRGIGETALAECTECHAAHDWRVDGEACLSCHSDVLGPDAGPAGQRSARASSGLGHVAPAADPAPGGTGPGTSWIGMATHVEPRLSSPAGDEGPRVRQEVPPFDHREHADVSCAECHSSERVHGEIIISTPQGCADCHHGSATAGECAACHRPAELASVQTGPVPMRLSVRDAPVERDLPFSHAEHAPVECESCHTRTARGGFGPSVECASCHAEHHVPDARCTACHTEEPASDAHTRVVHTLESCGGAGCHQRAPDPAGEPVYSYAPDSSPREACLVCHVDMTDHEPGEACAECHLVAARGGAAGAGRP